MTDEDVTAADENVTEADDALLAELRRLVHLADPVPSAVEVAARESYSWRTIDADLAELSYDSVLDDDRLAGVRAGDAPRTLTFESPSVVVEVEITERGDRRLMIGQVVPPAPGRIEVRHSGGTQAVDADEVGRFRVEDIAAGPVSLRCAVEGLAPSPVETAWVVI